MDPFAKLPTEIILLILESCCDFTSLDGLQQISSRAEQAFNTSYKAIAEHVLRKCSLTSEGLHNEFTLLASIESTKYTPIALLERLDRLSGGAVRPISISATNSLAAVRQAVSTAAKVHLTACACLQHLFDRLESAKPRRPIAPAAEIIERMHGELPGFDGETSQFAIDPPSWIETHRTHRGLWDLELFRHIYNAASTHWSWSSRELDFFTEQYVEWCRLEWGLEGIRTISECVVDLCSTEPTDVSHRFPFLIAIPSPATLKLQVCWSLPAAPIDIQVDLIWGRRRSMAKGRNEVFRYYNALGGGDKGPNNPLWKLDFRAFRRLGIPLWEGWRF
ncbi:hypothetical protein PENCOP_c003G00119 [Penicillium coprophilum]|uniref:F-box domain-containing protein n=1 Tax=Penicillium coprophilum TaxID=36646 RepID=A0A1V6UXY6_9EURO|nr:hypothetical protein PENCOP_c003G00119 [Penicillium coprophilum]